jgi:hypothetical protein
VTFAPATIALLASTTLPEISPLEVCAEAAPLQQRMKQIAKMEYNIRVDFFEANMDSSWSGKPALGNACDRSGRRDIWADENL